MAISHQTHTPTSLKKTNKQKKADPKPEAKRYATKAPGFLFGALKKKRTPKPARKENHTNKNGASSAAFFLLLFSGVVRSRHEEQRGQAEAGEPKGVPVCIAGPRRREVGAPKGEGGLPGNRHQADMAQKTGSPARKKTQNTVWLPFHVRDVHVYKTGSQAINKTHVFA